MHELVFLKLGGSVITDKTRPEVLDEAVLGQIAQVIAATLHTNPALRILIGHGGGSFGHHWANLYQTHQGVRDDRGWEGVVKVADAMGRLNRDVVRALITAGVPAMSVQPSASAITAHRRLDHMSIEALGALLHAGVVPIVYGDVAVDREQGAAIISTETIFAYLTPLLHPRRIVLVGERAVFTADPRRDPRAERIPVIDETNIEQVLGQTTGSHAVDVTGGMATKVETMWHLVSISQGLEVQLVGPDPVEVGRVLRAGSSRIGTLIRRQAATSAGRAP